MKISNGVNKKINKIYISGALTHANENIKLVYEKISKICQLVCSNIYVPHINGTDPIQHPGVTPQEVWQKNHREVASADLIIAYVGLPSLGVGAELEIARITNSDIILWWYKDEKVSRMALGNPAAVEQIQADNENDLYKKLNSLLKYKYELKK